MRFENKKFANPLPYNILNFPALEQVFSNLYLGIAEGAFEARLNHSKTKTRSWPYGGYPTEKGTDEWYLREGYGSLYARLIAAEALIDQINKKVSHIFHHEKETLSDRGRGEIAVEIAARKINIIELDLEITTKIYELTGARATSNKVGFDIFGEIYVPTVYMIFYLIKNGK